MAGGDKLGQAGYGRVAGVLEVQGELEWQMSIGTRLRRAAKCLAKHSRAHFISHELHPSLRLWLQVMETQLA